jgi:energy-coupling factor transporter ATP-binding protein EcfA2
LPEIKVENLSFTYENRSTPALIDVSFEMEKREFVLLAGQSGSGYATIGVVVIILMFAVYLRILFPGYWVP